jgi:uncharacterized membrane protein
LLFFWECALALLGIAANASFSLACGDRDDGSRSSACRTEHSLLTPVPHPTALASSTSSLACSSADLSLTPHLRGSLTLSGVLGAILVGTITFAAGGLSWAILLIAFFLTSSALSHYKSRTKEPLAEKFQKGYRRDLGQVLANGGWGAVIALAFSISPQPVLFFAFVGAMATVTADTWATELGVLRRARRDTTNGRRPLARAGVTLLRS